jgi:hypothetical protein
LVNAIWAEVVSLHTDWRTYLTLFGAGDEVISVLNGTAPTALEREKLEREAALSTKPDTPV